MPEYRVVWEIEVDAESPEDAAQQALRIQRDSSSLATVFYISENSVAKRNHNHSEFSHGFVRTVDANPIIW